MHEQLAALKSVSAAFDSDGIDYWLFGGWAVDFDAGEITRAHSDVDLAVWRDDLDRIVELLQQGAWRHAPDEEEDGGTGYERDGVRLELTYLVHDAEGHICIPLSRGLVRWAHGAFRDDSFELDGVRARLIARHALEP
jgi:hypothetical protein